MFMRKTYLFVVRVTLATVQARKAPKTSDAEVVKACPGTGDYCRNIAFVKDMRPLT